MSNKPPGSHGQTSQTPASRMHVAKGGDRAGAKDGVVQACKPTPFCHSFATHLLEDGYDVSNRARATETLVHHGIHARLESTRRAGGSALIASKPESTSNYDDPNIRKQLSAFAGSAHQSSFTRTCSKCKSEQLWFSFTVLYRSYEVLYGTRYYWLGA
jgi:hypothetical protein